MSDDGKLCYKAGGYALAYKAGGDALIYKAEEVVKTLVTFSWDAAGRDLDICGYWLGCPDMKIGYAHSTARTQESGAYHIEYSGDITQVEGAVKGFKSQCGAEMTHHIRLDKLKNDEGKLIPRDVPYAILVESNTPIVVQYSRLDTSAAEMALMTTIAYSEN